MPPLPIPSFSIGHLGSVARQERLSRSSRRLPFTGIHCLADSLGLDLGKIAERNVAKLRKRYPSGFQKRRGMNVQDPQL